MARALSLDTFHNFLKLSSINVFTVFQGLSILDNFLKLSSVDIFMVSQGLRSLNTFHNFFKTLPYSGFLWSHNSNRSEIDP